MILGTSHYGEPNRFGLTRKPFATPLGEAQTDGALVDALVQRAGDGVKVEDYCHAVEHSIEFQVLFLQRLYGPRVRILPILCGPLGNGARDAPARAARAGRALPGRARRAGGARAPAPVLGAGRRHGARRAALRRSLPRDRARGTAARSSPSATAGASIASAPATPTASGTWCTRTSATISKWCGSSPIYTFLRAVPEARGKMLRYDQWNIDEESVVSFAAMAFR